MERIVKASRAPAYLGPVKDGRSLPRDPFDPDAPPQSARHADGARQHPRRDAHADRPRRSVDLRRSPGTRCGPKLEANSPFMGTLDRGEVIAAYRRLYPAYSPADVFFAATTASRSWRGQVIEAERRAADPVSADHTWVFQLDWRTPIDGGRWGAHHGLDVPLVFDNVAAGAAHGRHRRRRAGGRRPDERHACSPSREPAGPTTRASRPGPPTI